MVASNGAKEKRPKANRDERGHYLPGHSEPGPGRPPGSTGASVKAAYLRALGLPADGKNLDRTQADALAQAIIQGALSGDVAAAREVRQATEGDAVNLTGPLRVEEFDWSTSLADLAGGPEGDRPLSHANGNHRNGS